jgi:hypothetical protein
VRKLGVLGGSILKWHHANLKLQVLKTAPRIVDGKFYIVGEFGELFEQKYLGWLNPQSGLIARFISLFAHISSRGSDMGYRVRLYS